MREKLMALKARTPKMSNEGQTRATEDVNRVEPADIDSLVEQGRMEAVAAATAAMVASQSSNAVSPQPRSEHSRVGTPGTVPVSNGVAHKAEEDRERRVTLEPVQQLREYEKLQRLASMNSKIPNTGNPTIISTTTVEKAKSTVKPVEPVSNTAELQTNSSVPFRAAHIPSTSGRDAQEEEDRYPNFGGDAQADTPPASNKQTKTTVTALQRIPNFLTMGDLSSQDAPADPASDTQNTNTEDTDIADWLELTGFHDATYRSRRLLRHRRAKALRDELENLELEEQLEGNYAVTRGHSNSLPPSETKPRPLQIMAPPVRPQAGNLSITSVDVLPLHPSTSKPVVKLPASWNSSPAPSPRLSSSDAQKRRRSHDPIDEDLPPEKFSRTDRFNPPTQPQGSLDPRAGPRNNGNYGVNDGRYVPRNPYENRPKSPSATSVNKNIPLERNSALKNNIGGGDRGKDERRGPPLVPPGLVPGEINNNNNNNNRSSQSTDLQDRFNKTMSWYHDEDGGGGGGGGVVAAVQHQHQHQQQQRHDNNFQGTIGGFGANQGGGGGGGGGGGNVPYTGGKKGRGGGGGGGGRGRGGGYR